MEKISKIVEIIDSLGSDINMRRDRPYTGQPHTNEGARGATEIKGITMRDLRDAFIRAFIISHSVYAENSLEPILPNKVLYDEAYKGPDAVLCENDIYSLKGDFDPMALSKNLMCEIEKLMGIYPNISPKPKNNLD